MLITKFEGIFYPKLIGFRKTSGKLEATLPQIIQILEYHSYSIKLMQVNW